MEGFDGRNRLRESDSRGAQVIDPVFTIGKRKKVYVGLKKNQQAFEEQLVN